MVSIESKSGADQRLNKQPVPGKLFKLEQENELRFEVEGSEKVVVILKNGLAEIFGTELTKDHRYTFWGGAKMAVYTWRGCSILLEGNPEAAYVSKETPMQFYINLHGCFEDLRFRAERAEQKGPVVMVCGPTDVGKTTLTRILLNYAVRQGRTPLFADVDVGQGSISVPGTLGLNVIERPADVESGFSQVAPLVYHYGSTSPGANSNLYDMLVGKCAKAMHAKFAADPKVRASGAVINTCGWTSGQGFKALLHTAKEFQVDVILVLDQEKLYTELVRDLPSFVKIIFTPKSGGVVTRSKEYRSEYRDSRIREYFYGTGVKGSAVTQFYPHSFDVPFAQMKIFKIGAPAIPDSCLPLGMKAEDNQTKLVLMPPGHALLHHILSLTFCPLADKGQAVENNVQGIIVVTAVDTERQMLTVLSPQPKPLPTDCIFLFSDVQFMDSH